MISFFHKFLQSITPINEVGWCEKLKTKYDAETEVVLRDGTRCDLVNTHEAIEVDWAKKWAEAIGQALYYALLLKKRPAIVLLVKKRVQDQKYIDRCQLVCRIHGITLYIEETGRGTNKDRGS